MSNEDYQMHSIFLLCFFKEPRRLARVFFCCSLEKQDFSLRGVFPDRFCVWLMMFVPHETL